MKKSFILLPLAVAVLSGCLPGGGKKKSSSGATSTPTATTGGGGGQPTVDPGTTGGPTTDVPAVDGYTQVTTAPVAGTEYIFGCYNGTSSSFLDGPVVASYYLSCQGTTSNAIKFLCEASGSGFTFKATSGTVSGKYLALKYDDASGKGSAGYETSPCVFNFGETVDGITVKTIYATFPSSQYGDQNYIFAQQPGKTTLSSTFKKYFESNYTGRLYVKG